MDQHARKALGRGHGGLVNLLAVGVMLGQTGRTLSNRLLARVALLRIVLNRIMRLAEGCKGVSRRKLLFLNICSVNCLWGVATPAGRAARAIVASVDEKRRPQLRPISTDLFFLIPSRQGLTRKNLPLVS